MTRPEIPASLHEWVAQRAGDCCEYCRLPQGLAAHRHEPDHVVPRQHGGRTTEENLALACLRGNRHKGPNVGSFDPLTGRLVPLFNPHTQLWADRFALDGATIRPLTPEARVRVFILHLNEPERVVERERLLALGVLG